MKRLACLVAVLALTVPVLAAEKSDPVGDFLVGPKVTYADDAGLGAAFAYQWKSTGLLLMFDVSAVKIDGVAANATIDEGSHQHPLAYNAPARTTGMVGVTLLVPIRKHRK